MFTTHAKIHSNAYVINDPGFVPTPEEEALYKAAEAETISCHVMLAMLRTAIDGYDQTSLLYEAGFAVADAGLKVLDENLAPSEIKRWKISILLATKVLENPEDPNLVKMMLDNAAHRAIGRTNHQERLRAGLLILAGAVLAVVCAIAIPFTAGVSAFAALIGICAVSAGLSVFGVGLFAHYSQKTLSATTNALAGEAAYLQAKPR